MQAKARTSEAQRRRTVMNRDNQFRNSASQAERRRMLELERASTLLEQAKLSETLDSVRMKSTVTGTAPTVDYPAGSGPWSGNYWLDGPEPPLGYAINEQEPVGTPAEVARSLEELAGAQAPTSLLVSGDVVEDPSSHPPPPKAGLRLKRFPR
jgi:hypothetical protein